MKYAYSFNGEEYSHSYDSKSKCMREARKAAVQVGLTFYYIGEVRPYEPYPWCFDVLEDISNDCYEATGYEDYLHDVSGADKAELQKQLLKTFVKWAKEHGQNPSNYFSVPTETVKKIKVWKEAE